MAGVEKTSVVERISVAESPIHRVMCEEPAPVGLFESVDVAPSPGEVSVMRDSLEVAWSHQLAGTVYDVSDEVAARVIDDLAAAGYWGLRVDQVYGGSGASVGLWAPFVRDMASVNPWLAGISSCHAALGPVNLVGTFGTDDQKARLLPPLAAGRRLGAFAVTEPGTASDWGAITTTATRHGDELLLSGEKLFITNAAPGGTVAVLCKVDGELRMLVVELPEIEGDRFRTVTYQPKSPRHVTNRGLIFDEFPVPSANLLDAKGRAVAYHGLNHGRVLVATFAAGMLRLMAGMMVPWVNTRETFGAPIGSRELVQRRLGRLAARIVACDALVAWTSQLLDAGYRGELECVTAKVVASEMLKEATLDLLLKTYASRAFLPGNLFSDALHDFVAPTVYEGENEILTLGFLSTLVKARLPLLGSPPPRKRLSASAASLDLDELTDVALEVLRVSGQEVDAAVMTHGPLLAERQAEAIELAQRIQSAAVMLTVLRYGQRQQDPLIRDAALSMASEIGLRLSGERPTVQHHQLTTALGSAMADGAFHPVADIPPIEIPMTEHATTLT